VNDGDNVLDLQAKPHAEFQGRGPFCPGNVDASGQLATQHPIFSLQVFEDLY
jgi:hypothetical protein